MKLKNLILTLAVIVFIGSSGYAQFSPARALETLGEVCGLLSRIFALLPE